MGSGEWGVIAPHPLIPSPLAGRGDKATLWRGGVLLCLVSNKRGHNIRREYGILQFKFIKIVRNIHTVLLIFE
uniref:hypothetical protein n=1 Tax=Hassallia byssoidea TaxID=482630 RepID=UPI000584A98D|nr:hypothetical protein [Hassalia byssoidea]